MDVISTNKPIDEILSVGGEFYMVFKCNKMKEYAIEENSQCDTGRNARENEQKYYKWTKRETRWDLKYNKS